MNCQLFFATGNDPVAFILSPEVDAQTAFQHPNAPAEADRPAAQPFEVGSDVGCRSKSSVLPLYACRSRSLPPGRSICSVHRPASIHFLPANKSPEFVYLKCR